MPRNNPQQETEYEEDLSETELEETEDLDEYDEEVGDEAEPEEQEGDEEVDVPEDTEEEEPEQSDIDAIVIPWHDENGDEKELEISLDEIPDLLSAAEYGKNMAKYAKDLQAYSQQNEGLITIGKGVLEDDFLKNVATWRASGHSEKEIAKSLYFQYYGQMDTNPNPTSADEEMPEVDETSRQYFDKVIERQVNPLKEKLARAESQQIEQQNLDKNNEIIASVMWEAQVPEFTKQEEALFVSTFRDMYPKYDGRKEILTPAQIKAVLKVTGIAEARKQAEAPAAPKARVATKPKTAVAVKARQAPTIAPAKTGSQAMRKSVSTANTRENRLDRLRRAGIF